MNHIRQYFSSPEGLWALLWLALTVLACIISYQVLLVASHLACYSLGVASMMAYRVASMGRDGK